MKPGIDTAVAAPAPAFGGMLPLAGKLLLAAVFLWIVSLYVDAGGVAAAVSRAAGMPLLAAGLLLAPNLVLQYAKWRLLLRRVMPASTRSDAAASLFSGFALGLVTPARVGEFGGRAYAVAHADAGALVALTAVDKLASLLVTVTGGVLACCLLLARSESAAAALLAVAALAALAPAVFLARRRAAAFDTAARLLTRLPGIHRRVLAARAALAGLDRGVLLRLLALSAAFYGVFVAQFALLVGAFGAPAGAPDLLAAAAVVMLLKTVVPPVSFGELGIREGATALVYAGIGVPAQLAVPASMLLFVLNVLLPAAAGGIVLALASLRRASAA